MAAAAPVADFVAPFTASDDDVTDQSSSSKFPSSSASFSRTQAFAFSSGNPRIEETRGLIHLFTQHPSDESDLPSGRKPLVCVLGIPNHMTYADFCQFCGSFIHNVLDMRIVRKDGMEDRYSILMWFDSQESADSFYKHFNGRQFSSLEEETCHMLFTEDVQYTGSIERVQPSQTSSSEQPTCAVCLGVSVLPTAAIDKAVTLKLQKMQAKLDKCIEEKKFIDQINESLMKNQELWNEKLQTIEEREKKASMIMDGKIRQLEEQLQDLMGRIEVGNTIDQHPLSNDIKEGTVFSINPGSSSGKPTKSKTKARH